jgi:hypothetical protein
MSLAFASHPRPPTPINFFDDLPFSRRWRKELNRIMNNGGWHFLGARAQQGKTVGSRQFVAAHPAIRSSTAGTRQPVAQAWAAHGRKPILRSLAESLGGPGLAAMPGRETLLPRVVARSGTDLIIVNNAHYLDYRQWQELLNFDDVCLGRHGARPAIAFSGVFTAKNVPGLPNDAAEAQQIIKRVLSFKLIRGHDRSEVREALEILLKRHSPILHSERAFAHAGRVFDLLTTPQIDTAVTGYVGAGDLVELVRHMSAVRKADPAKSVRDLIEKAFEDLVRHRQ